MRIIEPQSNVPAPERGTPKKRRSKLFLPFFFFMAVGAVGFWFWQQQEVVDAPTEDLLAQQTVDTVVESVDEEPVVRTGELREFTDNEFKIFYDNLILPNTRRLENPPTYTGSDIADARIRSIGEQRGYRLRYTPTVDLVAIDGELLQQSAADSWQALKASAQAASIPISLVSGYRSVDVQTGLFTSRLAATGATTASIEAGDSDEDIDFVLKTTALPGYSKHHTGYTLDFLCAGYVFENFGASPCHDWLAADNYRIAKEHGFIPSYPPLADAQGPDPEAWEYVWVGTERLRE